ncbi:hypothetical protein PFICI_06713 [Pestalotiopsis fici W106-1]|uniref:F-box domain-containing protein n=1 Tax=Pestalotiopsis fici (strain W106-1 / CGMCC3.15140) TaxID=1229662 RepID=W3X969_PESFW|nr:uncharacterized protein PFICI_06713 [Pestalotiopsis fici W106-1]ETS81711.1 hypothetical protein PFICI_06713 [Pestalotiopsis fici W106-1]
MPPGSSASASQTLTPGSFRTDDDTTEIVHSASVTHTNASEGPEITRVPGFKRLPYEILSYIVQELSLETIFDLAQTCHHFEYLVREVNLCKMLLRLKAPFSPEAAEAKSDGRFDRALRRLVKRRRAFAQASPYAMGIVGVADSYIYYNGWLLYVVGDRPEKRLHILDLQNTNNQEVIVNIPRLIARSIPESETGRKYTFRALYHAAGITTCLLSYTRPTPRSWLMVFNAQERQFFGTIPLESTIRLFVRNNAKDLVYGTHSEYDASGNRKWILHHYNMESQDLSHAGRMTMSDLVGYEVGSAVCFEIFDKYLYGCSNQTSFELEEIDWTSYYYCFRVSLDGFNRESIEVMQKRDAFRRQHREGPIDDRWTFLTLSQHEEDGSIKLTECRREWLNGGSENRRTYYTKDVRFDRPTSERDGPESTGLGIDGNDPWPDEPLVRLIRSSDRPNFGRSSERQFHPGDYGPSMFSRSKTYLSTYSHSCGTFMDLVDDPHPYDPDTQRLRIRTGSRTCNSSAATQAAAQHGPHDGQVAREDASRAHCNSIAFWPPDVDHREAEARADIFQRLNQAMNPAGLRGSVTAAGDCRTIVYSTSNAGGSTAMKVLVVLSFDPAIRMAGMIRAGSITSQNKNDDASKVRQHMGAAGPNGKVEKSDRETELPGHSHDDVHKTTSFVRSQIQIVPWSDKQNLSLPAVWTLDETPWAAVEEAMHHKLAAKYDFSYFEDAT